MANPPGAAITEAPTARNVALREFLTIVLPIVAAIVVAGYVAAQLQHGFLPGGDRAFPLAGVAVPNWHIFWMGLWTGYTMALVGQAAGIFALTYSLSILQFTSPAITPTTLVLTFLNPIGAIIGFRGTGQWNLSLARWVCIGGVLGGITGPFLRITLFSEPGPFRLLVGIILAFMGLQMLHSVYLRRRKPGEAKEKSIDHSGLRIETLRSHSRRLVIGYGDRRWSLSVPGLFVTGAAVGAIGSALGVGGGFLLVPIFVAVYGLPMYVLVSITIPYVVVNSAVGLVTYAAIMPAVAGIAVAPEWSWGLFAAAGGVLGAWWAAKSQRWVPDNLLKLMLGAITAVVGGLYVADFFVKLPFRV